MLRYGVVLSPLFNDAHPGMPCMHFKLELTQCSAAVPAGMAQSHSEAGER
jgi:hypothetical protein